MEILRKGKFKEEMDEMAKLFTSSMKTDEWIFHHDLNVDRAHLLMLRKQGIISEETCRKILRAIERIEKEGFESLEIMEDVHVAKETRIIEIAGEPGGALHAGRSRNDEVATCLRMASRESLLKIFSSLLKLRKTLLELSERHLETIMPGYTHLQHAQPTTLAHHLLAHESALRRDAGRIKDCFKRVNQSPLGASALVSTSLPIDREYVAHLLGFDSIITNSMDAVSSRDFLIECISVSSSLMTSLSRLAEELILWSSSEFSFVKIGDAFVSTSSIMPQKRNPDVAELIRAKCGSVFGALISSLSILKALPMSYNRDLQELTPHLRNALEISAESAELLSRMLKSCEFDEERMREEAGRGFTTATDLAERLVLKGIPFRKAYQLVSRFVSEGADFESFRKLMREELGREVMDEREFLEAVDVRRAVERRGNGGPSKDSCLRMIEEGKKALEEDRKWFEERRRRLEEAIRNLRKLSEEAMK
ncbi:MAG: argininosuccinate lyase [Archaeoglobi archaeon]|nr:argininosuccinate lyase [Archaeoglobi archaeon]